MCAPARSSHAPIARRSPAASSAACGAVRREAAAAVCTGWQSARIADDLHIVGGDTKAVPRQGLHRANYRLIITTVEGIIHQLAKRLIPAQFVSGRLSLYCWRRSGRSSVRRIDSAHPPNGAKFREAFSIRQIFMNGASALFLGCCP